MRNSRALTSAVVATLIVPFGIAAALLALFLTRASLKIYPQIGLVLLVGLIAKTTPALCITFARPSSGRIAGTASVDKEFDEAGVGVNSETI